MVISTAIGFLRPRRWRSTIERVSAIRAVVTAAFKSVIIGCCVVVATPACDQSSTSSTKPKSAISADSLIVSLDDVRRIADDNHLAPVPAADVHQPRHEDSDSPGPCRAVYDQQFAFGTGWKQFRSVEYSGTAGPADMIRYVTQAVAIYPDEAAARTVFDHFVSDLTACSALHARHFEFTVNKQDPATVMLKYPWELRRILSAKGCVLVDVEVSLPQPEPVAVGVLQTITDRIK